MSSDMTAGTSEIANDRAALIRQAFRLEYITLAWMMIEATVAIGSGIAADSLTLSDRPRSPDRTRSPVAVSQKREYFKYPLETIGDFAPAAANLGARRPIANSQKPAIGGHF